MKRIALLFLAAAQEVLLMIPVASFASWIVAEGGGNSTLGFFGGCAWVCVLLRSWRYLSAKAQEAREQ